MAVTPQRCREVLGDVLGGVDEPAEHDRVVAVGEQPGDDLRQLGELRVLRRSLELSASRAKPSSRRRSELSAAAVVGVGAGGGVGRLQRLVVGEVQDGGPAEASASSGVAAAPPAARVRSVAAAARGEDASARSSASADHQRTRWRSGAAGLVATGSRA